ncbi:MAG: hypothetical protein LBT40_08080, partial [Deltaproteobacteria bacterium]|nr:hypothetical protein [Deltaproteobacteria bacterium]
EARGEAVRPEGRGGMEARGRNVRPEGRGGWEARGKLSDRKAGTLGKPEASQTGRPGRPGSLGEAV